MGLTRNAFRTSVGKPLGKQQIKTSRIKWDSNINVDLRGIGCEHRMCMEVA
jgi:hypothetical protein